MRGRALLWATVAGFLAASLTAAAAHEVKRVKKHKVVRDKHVCVCSMGGEDVVMPAIPPIPPMPPIPPIPPIPPTPAPGAYWHMKVPPGGGPDVRVYRHGDGDEERVVIVRKGHRYKHDSADANRDGKVTHDEFIRRAEKRFKQLDEDNDGALSEDEAAPEPMPFTVPLPPPPPAPPAPDND